VTGLVEVVDIKPSVFEIPPKVIVHPVTDVFPVSNPTSVGKITLRMPPAGIVLFGVTVTVYEAGEKLL
jgi:hypothetical protein